MLTRKAKILAIIAIAVAASLILSSLVLGLAPYIWNGNINVPKPKAALTDTFTVNSALLNGSAVADPTNVVASDFPSSFTVGDSIVIVYSFTSTANTQIVITPSASSNAFSTLTWSATTLTLAVGASGTLTLTIPDVTTSGSISMAFSGWTS
jgi:hypothetical protein